MKKNLEKQWVQDWSVLDLRPMHRALLRRLAEQLVQPVRCPLNRKQDIVWHIASLGDSPDSILLAAMRRTGVLIVDGDGLLQRVTVNRDRDAVVNAMHQRSTEQIRLLWHWSLQGKQDLLWCTEMSFDGVISDARSLNQWLRVCLRHGREIEGQIHTLLQGIELPNLALPKSKSI